MVLSEVGVSNQIRMKGMHTIVTLITFLEDVVLTSVSEGGGKDRRGEWQRMNNRLH